MSETLFLENALKQGHTYVRSKSLEQDSYERNDAWSEYCQSLLLPESTLDSGLKSYTEQLTTIERIYSASLVYARAQSRARRKSLAMYFTPPRLSEYVLDRVEAFGGDFTKHRFIDPAAGGASFIGPIASRMSARGATHEQIAKALRGVEIDPALANFARAAARCVVQRPVKHLVACGDGLVYGQPESFDAVIGNPPYKVLSPSQREKMPDWAKVVLGNYANLYSLFILRGIQLLRSNGLLALLVPTSFITGTYFRPLRKYISENSTILAIDKIEQRRQFFRDVSQDICLLVCRKAVEKRKGYSAQARSVDRNISWRCETDFWITRSSDELWSRLYDNNKKTKFDSLEALGFTVRCGPIVHNRDKGLSDGIRRRRKDAVPLVWGHVIQPFLAVEPASRSRQPGSGAITFVSTQRITPPVTTPSIVLQRTNSGDQEKRIRAGLVDEAWIAKYGGFYGENHVVVISPDPQKKQRCSLRVLLRLLSTKAVDRRLRLLLSSNSINVTALRDLQIPKLSKENLSSLEGYSDVELETILEEAYG
ncbi:N-6 DNA methylase [Ruegeria sp. Ofav3-42]|uniref:Eco57I restriction-modification methylase domain-containing protein n=1 Tax=Ruegeria sp. Ofav3-42 TaxID=2917759 RepID=UPI001EF46915|nr:N-6 DNA methylase [Ruegeria sp. Ofav3-42]MCG7519486.1 class I SAM-dependent methyltransferase [Ruegeria sp. Ofav3-42]